MQQPARPQAPQSHRRSARRRGGIALCAAAALLAPSVLAPPVSAAPTAAPLVAGKPTPKPPKADKNLPKKLVKKISVDGAWRHLVAFQRIADTYGSRASNTPGYDASVDYVAGKLRAAGFLVSTPSFTYQEEETVADSLTVDGSRYQANIMSGSVQSPAGGVSGPFSVAPEDGSSGCQAEDWAGIEVSGTVALVRRGGCNFSVKAQFAADAGAVGVVVSNNVDGGLNGSIGVDSGITIPVAGISKADGDALAGKAGADANLDVRYRLIDRTSRNVIAQTRTGRTDNVVMSGAHLDGVPDGPGINDNGSGSATQLQVALQLGSSPKVANAVRFAWWGTEELGLLGADAYVAGLSQEDRLDIALYLNFDMVGSSNAGYFVYDGDDSDQVGSGAGPYGSADIEKTFQNYLNTKLGVPTEGTDFNGRSDYGPFIAVGIPSGGLFTGAEGVKTPEQQAKWGGTAGAAYDPCYHSACDNLGNISRTALDRNLKAMAWAVASYGVSTEGVNGMVSRAQLAKARGAQRVSATASAPGATGTPRALSTTVD